MKEAKWKLEFRLDQAEFIVAAMGHICAECDEQSAGLSSQIRKFTAKCTKERALEIAEYIEAVTR